MSQSDRDSDYKFSNLRQKFETQKENEIKRPNPPILAPRSNLVPMRTESMRTPTELMDRRRAFEVKNYREIVSKSVSDDSESDDDSSKFAENSGSYDLGQTKVQQRKVVEFEESTLRDTSIISSKIFEVSSFLFQSGNTLSSNLKKPQVPKKPIPPLKPSLKIYRLPSVNDKTDTAQVNNETKGDRDNRNSVESFDSDEFDDTSETESSKEKSTEELEHPSEARKCSIKSNDELQNEADTSDIEKDVKLIAKTPRVIQEILESEQAYIANLKRGIDEYIVPFESVSLPSALVGKKRILFSNIEVIHRLHESRFYPSLLECGFDPEKIADAFSSFIDGFDFDVYIVYILNRNKSEKLCREHEDFFKEIQQDQLGIGSFLTQPIQRLPKYQLLVGAMVKDLMKDLDENKSAIAACCRAEKHIQRLLNTVNEYC